MEKFQASRSRASSKLALTSHMLTQTYPSLKDPKLFAAIIENLFNVVEFSIDSVLEYELLFKKIPSYNTSFQGKVSAFQKCSDRLGFDKEMFSVFNSLLELKKISSKELSSFAEGRVSFIDDDLRAKTITLSEIKKVLYKTTDFFKHVEEVTKKNEGIFR